ncbi:MAG TPA: hypothetical protein VHM91_15405 [Verrucomicrobiales bacterium]|nr:hypothetical protein [Verrucomicrobiales bacterium]
MASQTEIANLALGHFGQSRITSFGQDHPGAEAVRDCWDFARDAVLRAHHWNFATAEAVLTEIASAPLVGWARQFALPADFRRLVSCNGVPAGTRDTEFSIRGNVLVTNDAEAKVEYVRNVTACEEWDPDFVLAFSFQLAELIAPRLSLDGGMSARLAQRKQDAGLTAMVSDATDSRPNVRKAQEGSGYLQARAGWDAEIG